MKISLERAAREYVDTLNGPANGWGQHVHPVFGRSDYMLLRMSKQFGEKETNAAIDAEFSKRKGNDNGKA